AAHSLLPWRRRVAGSRCERRRSAEQLVRTPRRATTIYSVNAAGAAVLTPTILSFVLLNSGAALLMPWWAAAVGAADETSGLPATPEVPGSRGREPWTNHPYKSR